MKISPFILERYFAKYEFSAPYMMSSSDCESLEMMKDVLSFMDPETNRLWHNLRLSYTETQGHPLLREEISKLYKTVKADEVFIAAPEECIFITMNSILEPGDHIVATFPGYQSLYEIAKSIGCSVSFWKPETDNENNFSFNTKDLFSQINDKTKMIIFNFPHNPTGATITNQQLQEIVDFAREKGINIFSDEMYRMLEYNEKDRLDSVCDIYEKGIALSGLSKSFSMPGLRIGWLCVKEKEMLNKFLEFKDYTTICNSAPSEILAIMGLRGKNQILERNLEIIKTNLNLLDKFFEKYSSEFAWKKPVAGPIAFPLLKIKMKVEDFALNLVNKKGIMILPASVYNYDGNNFRIGFGRKNIPQILEIFEDYLLNR